MNFAIPSCLVTLLQIAYQLANSYPRSQLDPGKPALRFVVVALIAVRFKRLGLVVNRGEPLTVRSSFS